jgi:hypothetical protein
MEFLYEPYFLSLLVALICTFIYYFIEKNKQPIHDEPESKKKSLSPLLKSILLFIFSYSLFTALFYAMKHYLFPKGNITLSEEIPILDHQENTDWLGKIQSALPSISLTLPSLLSKEEPIQEEKKQYREERRERRMIDETLIAGKKKSPIKDKDSLRHMNSKDAKFADHDIEFDLKAFDMR